MRSFIDPKSGLGSCSFCTNEATNPATAILALLECIFRSAVNIARKHLTAQLEVYWTLVKSNISQSTLAESRPAVKLKQNFSNNERFISDNWETVVNDTVAKKAPAS
jgi:hypothetical protein